MIACGLRWDTLFEVREACRKSWRLEADEYFLGAGSSGIRRGWLRGGEKPPFLHLRTTAVV